MSEDLEPIEKVEPPCQIYYLQSSSGKVYRCYRTSEADKVIADLKADYKEACDRLQTANLIKDEQKAKAGGKMKTLTLSLKKKWFDMIKSGEKKEEYREIKPHYIRQFIKFEPLKNDLIIDYNFHRGFDEGEINGIEKELLNLKYDVLEFSLAYPSRAEKDKWLTFKNPRIRIGTGKPEWGAEHGKIYFVISWEE